MVPEGVLVPLKGTTPGNHHGRNQQPSQPRRRYLTDDQPTPHTEPMTARHIVGITTLAGLAAFFAGWHW
jgi:hypothetical protein